MNKLELSDKIAELYNIEKSIWEKSLFIDCRSRLIDLDVDEEDEDCYQDKLKNYAEVLSNCIEIVKNNTKKEALVLLRKALKQTNAKIKG